MQICCVVVEIRELAVGDGNETRWRRRAGVAEQPDVRGKPFAGVGKVDDKCLPRGSSEYL